jgi:rubrerythrin
MKPEARNHYRRLPGGNSYVRIFICCVVMIASACRESNDKREINTAVVSKQLQEVYARAVNYSRMYSTFASRAVKEHKKNVSELFTVLAHSEELRAMIHANLLLHRGIQPIAPPAEEMAIGNVRQMLKMAMSSENLQYYDVYPNAIKLAGAENDTAAIEQFQAADELDARHRELINEAINQLENNPGMTYSICERCGYIFTSDREKGCPVCRKFKTTFGKI